MIIAIDLDDVLAQSTKKFIEFHNKEYKTNLKYGDIIDFYIMNILDISKEEEGKRMDEFDEKHLHEIEAFNEAQKAVKRLSKKHELVIVTSRPQSQEKLTKKWVEEHFPEIKKIFFIRKEYNTKRKTKGDVCKEIGARVLIEDRLKYAEEAAADGVRVLLVDCPWNQSKKLVEGIVRVQSWDEIESEISYLK